MPKKKPAKPYPEFPLYAHAGGVWAKKIKGKLHYFGPWNDPNGALKKYLSERDYLHSGLEPPAQQKTVANLLDRFMDQKQSLLTTGEIEAATFDDYEATCKILDTHFGKNRTLESLTVTDFNALRTTLSKRQRKGNESVAPVTLKRRLTVARMVFADQPLEFRKALKSPPKKLLRKERQKQGKKLYSAKDVRALVNAAQPLPRAMVLLGINCGFGPQDCCTLHTDDLDLKNGWHSYARPKTEIERRCWLWPETVKALKAVSGKDKVFEGHWDRFKVGDQFRAICKSSGVNYCGFYSLRRTFETIAANAEVNQAVIDKIMGHEGNDMASVYRQKIFDDMIRKCANFVRAWYLGEVVID